MHNLPGTPRPKFELAVNDDESNLADEARSVPPIPFGVILIAIWMFIGTVLAATFVFVILPEANRPRFGREPFQPWVGPLYFSMIPLYIVLGVGLLLLKPWARKWTIGLCAAGVALSFFTPTGYVP